MACGVYFEASKSGLTLVIAKGAGAHRHPDVGLGGGGEFVIVGKQQVFQCGRERLVEDTPPDGSAALLQLRQIGDVQLLEYVVDGRIEGVILEKEPGGDRGEDKTRRNADPCHDGYLA